MSGAYESLKETYGNFQKYVKYSTIPAIEKSDNSRVPQNSFYKSVYYIDSALGPIKDMIVGVNYDSDTPTMCLGRRNKRVYGKTYNLDHANIANLLLVLYTGFAYVTYLPYKLFSYLKGIDGPKSLVEYANNLQGNAETHGEPLAKFLSLALSCIISAFIWAPALVITPLVWVVDKVASKFSGVKEPEAVNPHENGVNA
ncbi:uncharacterized protein TNCT_625231 [Trichonephila clavata]|uniref:Uncharacterized protein n=1 Tax=Trichonephila clavata TaxID=2740835 RepID=A0A8X6HGM3_TRICU|nr:uncharacterized protein TNCT_20011 [Trichonephila clavata]GFR23417.1 uncharacterized protein TNCT_625231 [Trichonephila clavata]